VRQVKFHADFFAPQALFDSAPGYGPDRALAVPQGLTFPLIAENVKLMPLPGSEVVDFPP